MGYQTKNNINRNNTEEQKLCFFQHRVAFGGAQEDEVGRDAVYNHLYKWLVEIKRE